MQHETTTRFILLIVVGLLFYCSACVPPSQEIKTEVTLNWKDPVFQQIKEMEYQSEKDSLYAYFTHQDPTYRYLAAMAFASIQDSTALDSLALLLKDPVDEVRAAAAFAIGQTRSLLGEALLTDAFSRTDTAGDFRLANQAILEAIGKCGSPEMLDALVSISTYTPTDTLLLEGQSWGIYRYALREITTQGGTALLLKYATDPAYPPTVRFIAGHYLGRTPELTFDSLAGTMLGQTLTATTDPKLRMTMAKALAKAPDSIAVPFLLEQFDQEQDHRVKINLLSSLGQFDYLYGQERAVAALRSPQLTLARQAAQYFVDNGIGADATFYWRMAKDSLPWPIQLSMYKAANRHLPTYYVEYRDAINAELRRWLRRTSSVYEKGGVLDAMSEFPWNYKYIYQNGFHSESPVVRTAAVEALAAISNRRDFRGYFGNGYRIVRRDLLAYFTEAIDSGDPGIMAVAAGALRNKRLGYEKYVDSLTVFKQALEQLELPKAIETYNELQHTIAYLEGTTPPPPRTPDYNRDTDWGAMDQGLNDQKTAIIETSLGDIELKLLPNVAPATVANFIGLAKQNFFDGKVFHRVVPNFVAQGGCPRGDGYGSLDYTIRSEFSPLHYDRKGYLGMASAGAHTECTQFFITHSPTPHLDGRYTIFAKVQNGMDIVHQLGVSSPIKAVTLQ